MLCGDVRRGVDTGQPDALSSGMRIVLTPEERDEIAAAIEADRCMEAIAKLLPSYVGADDIEVEEFLRALLVHAEIGDGYGDCADGR